VLAVALAGCGNFFVTKHKVLVDAISAPGAAKPSGQSYRLVAKKSIVNSVPVQVPVVKACIDAALGSAGMFEAPGNSAPDVVIEVGFGQDSTPRVDPSARETYLQLSARSNPKGSIDKATGEELWDVRVAVLGIAGRIETAMPLLCSVAANYIATDTHVETRIEIPQNSPMVAAVRENAIKALDNRNAPAAASDPNSPVPNSVTVGPAPPIGTPK
jgi:hypothetical protein